MHRHFSSTTILALTALLMASAAAGQVKVERTAPKVTTHHFDPRKPPADMPPLKPGEAAVCESKYACHVQVEVEISQTGQSKPVCTIVGVQSNLSLEVTIWLPDKASGKIRAHEEGHRQISETYYARGEQVAADLAKKYMGRTLDVKSADAAETRPVIRRVANEFCQEYLGAVEVPSERAQKKYDQLTDHGRNRVSEKEAIKKAMASAQEGKR